MPRFKVSLHRRLRSSYDNAPEPNPFLAGLPPDGQTVQMHVREWEFEAKNMNEVHRLLEEARQQDIPAVRGYTLRNIEELPVSEPAPISKGNLT